MTEIRQHIGEYFNDLSFEEERHKYRVRNKELEYSVSGLVSKFENRFDADLMSGLVAKKEGVSKVEILKKWEDIKDEAITRGNRVHLFGELYARNRTLIPTCEQEEAVVKFWKDLPDFLELVDLETQMYHKEYMFAGTADILLYNRNTNTFVILDYKTNKDLFKNHNNQTLSFPFEDLLDNPFNKYQIQLSFYQILIEQTGLQVSSRKVIWLQRDGTYLLYDTDDFRRELREYLSNN